MRITVLFFLYLLYCFNSSIGQNLQLNKVLPFEKNCTYGLKTNSDSIILKPKYWNIEPLSDELYMICNKKKKKGVVNAKGRNILPSKYDSIVLVYTKNNTQTKYEKTIKATLNNMQFYYTSDGILVPSDSIKEMENDCGTPDRDFSDLIFNSNKKFGLKDWRSELVPPIFDSINDLKHGLFACYLENKVMIYSDISDFIDTFENILIYYSNDLGTILVIDKSNKLQGIYSVFEGGNPVYVKPKYYQILKFYQNEKLLKIKHTRKSCPNFINYLLEN